MTNKTAEEVRDDLVKTLGEEFASDWTDLINAFYNVLIEWRFYRSLFGTNPERINLLNSSSGIFAATLDKVFFEAVIVALCWLSDPVATGRGKTARANLTFARLERYMSSEYQVTEFKNQIVAVNKSVEFARDWRNRKIAHADLLTTRRTEEIQPASRAAIQTAIDTYSTLVEWLYREFLNTTIVLNPIIQLDDEIRFLQDLFEGVSEREDRLRRQHDALRSKKLHYFPEDRVFPDWLTIRPT